MIREVMGFVKGLRSRKLGNSKIVSGNEDRP
jgi:hypothetical protein